jgi:hypothetical protein
MKSFKLFIVLGASFFLLFFILIVGGDTDSSSSIAENTSNLPEAVLRWKEKVTTEATKNNISEAVPYLLGIIMVETGGNAEKYPDIMQCSGATRFLISV